MNNPIDPLQALARVINDHSTDTGMLARVRRNPPGAAEGRESIFETQALLFAAGIEPPPGQQEAWTLMAHCLAVARGGHQSRLDTGEILARAGYKEARMRLLIEADPPLLADLLPRLARYLAGDRVTINWWPLANLLGLGSTPPDKARLHLVQGFLRVPQPK